jgi:hypothetical protein
MSIETILKNVAPEAAAPDPEVVDADLARGRAALTVAGRRRTHRRLGGAGVLVAAAAAVVVLAASGGSHTLRPSGATAKTGQIKLVDYSGAQLPGFTVSQVPQGWHLSTSTPYALLITPDNGSTNDNPDDFQGKLAVLTSSTDQQGLGKGDAVTVNGQAGVVYEQDGYLNLNYNAPNGFGINIQAPDALGWTKDQIVAFADGVQVTSHAIHSVG